MSINVKKYTKDQMAIEFEVEDAVAEQRAYKVRRLRSWLEYVEREN